MTHESKQSVSHLEIFPVGCPAALFCIRMSATCLRLHRLWRSTEQHELLRRASNCSYIAVRPASLPLRRIVMTGWRVQSAKNFREGAIRRRTSAPLGLTPLRVPSSEVRCTKTRHLLVPTFLEQRQPSMSFHYWHFHWVNTAL